MSANRHEGRANLLTRRTALKGVGAVGIAAAFGSTAHAPADASTSAGSGMIEPTAASWKTWVLASGAELRPPAPPAAAESIAAATDAAPLARVAYWDAGAPGYRWNERAMQQTLAAGYGPGDAYRTMALLNVAIYDATIAAWDAKYAYHRPRPAAADPSLSTAIPTPASPSYPSVHAATAGAAAGVLAYLFPKDASAFAQAATEAAQSRIDAGVAYPSDLAAGLDLGQQVAARVVAWAKTDGSDAKFDPASIPTGPGLWSPKLPASNPPGDPVYPMLGTWKTWVLSSGSQFRPGPPPAPDSPERAAEIAEIKHYPRDAHPFTELFFWPQDPAGRPAPDTIPFSSNQVVFYYAPVLHYVWGPELAQKLFEYRLDANPPRAARAAALVSIASYDASVACWEAKFHYWTARPNQFDASITTVLPTYPIPDYPSGHAATLGGTAEVLAHLFPRDAHFFQSRATENAASRMWAGIHFRSACEAGVALGRRVGQAVIARAARDGAE
jgi:membrane-associated phospholipid phosphatase